MHSEMGFIWNVIIKSMFMNRIFKLMTAPQLFKMRFLKTEMKTRKQVKINEFQFDSQCSQREGKREKEDHWFIAMMWPHRYYINEKKGAIPRSASAFFLSETKSLIRHCVCVWERLTFVYFLWSKNSFSRNQWSISLGDAVAMQHEFN